MDSHILGNFGALLGLIYILSIHMVDRFRVFDDKTWEGKLHLVSEINRYLGHETGFNGRYLCIGETQVATAPKVGQSINPEHTHVEKERKIGCETQTESGINWSSIKSSDRPSFLNFAIAPV
jgi:hypothetical protein